MFPLLAGADVNKYHGIKLKLLFSLLITLFLKIFTIFILLNRLKIYSKNFNFQQVLIL